MILTRHNVVAQVGSATNGELAWLWSTLEFRRRGRASHVVNKAYGTFPAGLLPLVVSAAARARQKVDVIDVRRRPCEPVEADTAWLRPYQALAVEHGLLATRGIFHLPTGSGKTELAVALAQRLPCRWAFLSHRGTLMRQSAARYNMRTGRTAGIIGEGQWEDRGGQFTVAMIETLARRLKSGDERAARFLGSIDGFIADEAHLFAAPEWYSVLMSMSSAYWRFGLSGTPLGRSDGRSLLILGAIGPVIHRLKADVLIDTGALAKPTVKLSIHRNPAGESATWEDCYRKSVVDDTSRNELLVRLVAEAAKPCLVFVRSVSHGRKLASLLADSGMKTAYAHGAHDTSEREQAVRAAESGVVACVVCTVIFQEGLDSPVFRSVVVGAGGKSDVASIQRIGRAMRPAPGKDACTVYDIDDKGCGCGGVHNGCRWLIEHTRRRIAAYLAEGYRTTV